MGHVPAYTGREDTGSLSDESASSLQHRLLGINAAVFRNQIEGVYVTTQHMSVTGSLIFGQTEVICPLLRPNQFSAFLDTYDKETLPRDWLVLGFLSIYTMT